MQNKNKTDIIDHIYDVAIDPSRLEELIDAWEARIAPLRSQFSTLGDDEDDNFSHFSRMGLFLDRLQFSDPQDIINDVSESGSLAAMLVSKTLEVKQLNTAATEIFNLQVGDIFGGVSGEHGALEALVQTVSHVINAPPSTPKFLRFRLPDNERFIVVRVHSLNDSKNQNAEHKTLKNLGLASNINQDKNNIQDMALIVTTELAWQPQFGASIKAAFDLTSSEVEIVRALVEGHTISSIATARNRSKATIRVQIRSIFEKTQTQSQAELVRISLSLMDMINYTEENKGELSDNLFVKPTLSPTIYHSITRPNQRRLDHIIIGDPHGKPMLYLPGSYGFIRWPASAEAYAKQCGIKVIVPVRAGYGHSDRMPRNVNYQNAISDDFAALLDHHNITSCPIISYVADICFASIFAARHIDRVSSIISIAPMLPLWKREQYERMDKWYKFIVANARFTPKILPYLVKAAFYLALSVGQRSYFDAVFANSPADRDTYNDPEIFEAMITGGSVIISKEFTAHEAFAREAIIRAASDWAKDLQALKGKIPIHAFMGVTSPMVPPATLEEYKQRYDWIVYHHIEDSGDMLFFKHWRKIIDFSKPFLK